MEFTFAVLNPQPMKNLYLSLPLLALILICIRCSEDPEPLQKKVSIDFTVSSGDETLSDLPQDSRLVLNIQTTTGEPVMEYQEVKFTSSKNRFSTEPLGLPYGNYVITDLMIVDNNDDILYAAPKLPGSLASSVEHPLSFNFLLSSDARLSGLSLRLMDVRKYKPGDFGYASFKKPGMRINVMITAEDSGKPVAARAFLLNDMDTIARYKLTPKMNQISVPAGAKDNSRLVVTKEGYAPVRFLLSDILASDHRKPLQVALTPAFTMLAFIGWDGSTFEFYLGGPEGAAVSIDWGDGSTGSFDLSQYMNIVHPYASAGNYSIAITGNIDKITSFSSYYGYAMVDAFDFSRLSDLREFDFGLTRSPAAIDLRQNGKLESLELIGLDNLRAVYLPESHQLHYLSFTGPNKISTEAADALINNLYRNTAAKNITNGVCSLAALWYQEEGDEALAGPPSASSMASLKTMKESYGWTIFPDPFD